MTKKSKKTKKGINLQEYRIIKALLNFKDKTDEESENGLEQNLPLSYYTKKIKGKFPKCLIKKDFKRKDGWMYYRSLEKQASISEGSIGDKIKYLVSKKAIEKRKITWVHYKNKGKHGG